MSAPQNPQDPNGYGQQPGYDPHQNTGYGQQAYDPQQAYGQGGYGTGYDAAPGGVVVQNKKALWSLITGIISIFTCLILGVIAIVLGVQAKKEIEASRGTQTGLGQAKAGLICGIIGVVVNLGFIVYALSRR